MKRSKFLIASIATLCFATALFFGAKTIFAGVDNNAFGYAWSSNIGWIKMNNCEDPARPETCTGTDYGVSILPAAPGTITGYAWSSNIGWITFNSSAECPVSGCTPGARVDWANKNSDGSVNIRGWARACSVYASGCSGEPKESSALGGWDGYIALDSASAGAANGAWGWKIGANKAVSGFGWGSEVFGWIKSISISIDGSGIVVGLAANPTTIPRGNSSTLTVTARNIDGPNACSGLPAPIVMTQGSDGNWTATQQVSPYDTTIYTVTCTKGALSAQAQATVEVTYFNTPNEGIGNGAYCAVTNPRFAWNSTATSCTLTRQGGGSQTVAGSSRVAGGSLGSDGLYYYTSSLSVQGNASNYTLQCGSAAAIPLTVNRCIPDFAIVANPNTKVLAAGAEGKMTATFTVSIIPTNGFTGPINLSVASWPAAIPSSKTGVFSPVTLTDNGGTYGTSQFTVTIDAEDLTASTTYSPVIIQGKSSTLTRQASVSVGSEVKTKPIYTEF